MHQHDISSDQSRTFITGKKRGWGNPKIDKLNRLLDKLYIIDINNSDHQLIKAYYTIDSFSQGKLAEKPLNNSAKNMGKNDLWIAATAYVTNSKLITTDKDFNHLNNVYFDVLYVDGDQAIKG